MAYYKILDVEPLATVEAMKKQYMAKALLLHPDKETGNAAAFQALQEAWEVLRDEASRKTYDAEIQVEMGLHGLDRIASTMTLSEMDWVEPAEGSDEEGFYRTACRCGDWYILPLDAVDAGVSILHCQGCSLAIEVADDTKPFQPSDTAPE